MMKRLPFLCLFIISATAAETAPKPNVILIMTDDQGYGDLACHGHPFLKTPNLDKLHAESIRLTDFHVSPLCSPTRASLMTGRYCRHVGVTGTGSTQKLITRGIPTMADLFGDNGYSTAIFGKWHLGRIHPYRPIDRGFQEALVHGAGAVSTIGDVWGNDYFDDTYWHNGKKERFEGFCTDVWFENAKKFISRSNETGKPFFCYIPTNIVHGPHYAPKKYVDLYADMPGKAPFFGAITHFDKCVGELREFLVKQGVAKNTIFIFMTDNGSGGGRGVFDGGMKGGKSSSFEGGHRVPLFIYWPDGGLTGGRDVDQLSAHIDVLPTLVDLCVLKTRPGYKADGLSLKPALCGKGDAFKNRVLVESFNGIVMTRQWRLLRNKAKGKKKKQKGAAKLELYDIRKDPLQRHDVAGAHPDVVARLSAELDRVNGQNPEPDHRYLIGTDQHNPVEFTPDQWVNRKGLGWWQSEMIQGKGMPGTLRAEVARDGTYAFSLRRWPEEVDKPISSSIQATVPADDYGRTKVVQTKAVPIVKARLKIGDFDRTLDVTKDMVAAEFQIPLKKGPCDIYSEFIDKSGRTYGVYYLIVKRQ